MKVPDGSRGVVVRRPGYAAYEALAVADLPGKRVRVRTECETHGTHTEDLPAMWVTEPS